MGSIRVLEESIAENHPIVRAIDQDQAGTVAVWLHSGHSSDARINNKVHERLLDRAASQASVRTFELLLRDVLRMDRNAKLVDARGTPLLVVLAALAVRENPKSVRIESMMKFLLKVAPRVLNDRDKAYVGDGRTALHQVAANGNLSMIKLLVQEGAPVNATNSTGETPLHLAARFGHLEAVKYLISAGAMVNVKTKYTRATPLMAAAEMGNADVIRTLMAAGAHKNDLDAFGKNAPQRYKEHASLSYDKIAPLKKSR